MHTLNRFKNAQYIDYTLCNARKTLIMRFSFDKIKIRKTTQKKRKKRSGE